MIRLALVLMLACGPVFANARADSEAKLAELAVGVVAALQAVAPQPEGMACKPAPGNDSPTNRMFLPVGNSLCKWIEGGERRETKLVLGVSASVVAVWLAEIAQIQARMADGTLPESHARFFGKAGAMVMRVPDKLTAGLSPVIAAYAATPEGADFNVPDAMDRLAEALAGIDSVAFAARPAVRDYLAALAAHRQLLEAEHRTLATMLPPALNGRAPAGMPPPQDYPDHRFFGVEPFVQTIARQSGVTMQVTLTTSSFALEAAADDGRFAGREAEGEMGARGVFHNRGRVQLYLADKGLTALIDGRGTLVLDVTVTEAGADRVAAMETVLAGIAANDFSGY